MKPYTSVSKIFLKKLTKVGVSHSEVHFKCIVTSVLFLNGMKYFLKEQSTSSSFKLVILAWLLGEVTWKVDSILNIQVKHIKKVNEQSGFSLNTSLPETILVGSED